MKYDADGRIDQDLPCLECGYNLRSLLDDAQCPECGASVQESARLGWLCQYDPAWLRRLAAATRSVQAAVVCFAAPLAFVLWAAFADAGPGDAVSCFMVSLVVGAMVGLGGAWDFTEPHPGAGVHDHRVRLVARCATAAGLVGLLTLMVFTVVAVSTLFSDPSLLRDWMIPPLALFVLACLGVGAWATLTYAAALVDKIPAARLATQLRIIAWGTATCFGICATAGAALLLLPDTFLSVDLVTPVAGALVAACVGLIVMSIWSYPLLACCRSRFNEAALTAAR